MRLCNDTVTVFNTKLDQALGDERYYPTIISGVSWFQNVLAAVDGSGLRAANQLILRIPTDADFSGKTYLSPGAFAVTEDPDSAFTLKAGDIVVHAAVSEALRPSEIKERGYEMATILGVTDNRRAPNAPHWKVVGK